MAAMHETANKRKGRPEKRRYDQVAYDSDGQQPRQLEVHGHGDDRVLHCTHCLETIRPWDTELKPGRLTDCARRHFNANCVKHWHFNTTVCAAVDTALPVEKHCVCRREYTKRQGIMFRCRLCFVWHHPKCIRLEGPDLAGMKKHPERFVCPGCLGSLARVGRSLPVGVFKLASLCAGINHDAMALTSLEDDNLAPGYCHVWSAEHDCNARQLVEAFNQKQPGYASQTPHRDLVAVDMGLQQRVTLTTAGVPCEESSPNMNGHTIAKSLTQSNQLIGHKIGEMLGARLTDFLLVECDSKYFNQGSEPFKAVQRGMQRGGYTQLFKGTLSPLDFKLPQTRARVYFVATVHEDRSQLVGAHLDVLKATSEHVGFESFLLNNDDLHEVGITDVGDLSKMGLGHPSNARHLRGLESFFADPNTSHNRYGLSLEEAMESMYVLDIKNSHNPNSPKVDWMRLSPMGCCPTVTASHNEKSIVVLHKAHFRFLLPHEHALLQGWDRPRVATAHDLFCKDTGVIGTLAGRGFHVQVVRNLILAVLRSFPEQFYKE